MNHVRHTAIHEAGHAVIGRVLGFPCGGATIVPDAEKGTAGSAHVNTGHAAWDRWMDLGKARSEFVLFRAGIIVLLAGEEAEKQILGNNSDGYEGDYEHALHLSMEMSDVSLDPEQRVFRRLQRQTARLVRKHRVKIERAGDALLDKHTLSSDEINALMC